MRSYVKKTVDIGGGRKMITTYTLGESLILDIIKLFFFIFILWPIEICFWLFVYFIKFCVWLILLPFRLLKKH